MVPISVPTYLSLQTGGGAIHVHVNESECVGRSSPFSALFGNRSEIGIDPVGVVLKTIFLIMGLLLEPPKNI